MNHFKKFNLSEGFNIDKSALKKKYLALHIQYHPDKAATPEEKISFLNSSIELNEGYKILLDDLSRASYLLKQFGFDILNEERRFNIDANILSDAITAREQLEEYEDLALLQEFQLKQTEHRNDILFSLEKYFTNKDYTNAANETIKLKYTQKLLEDIRNKISKINATS
jgi:Fe-S protein assembly co-chaperone HscB